MDSSSRSEPVILSTSTSEASSDAEDNRSLVDQVQALMTEALPPRQRDDRFDAAWPPSGLLAAVETSVGRSASHTEDLAESERLSAHGFLGGVLPDNQATPWALDGLLADPSHDGHARALALWMLLTEALPDHKPTRQPAMVELWGRPAQSWHGELARTLGLRPNRALLQLRAPLVQPTLGDGPDTPADQRPTPQLMTRAFDPDRDLEALQQVNNRAFAWHPDQGNQSTSDILTTMTQPWFRAEGLRVADDPDHPDRLLGFCWTKIHEVATAGSGGLGEIFVIGVDPDHHGKGFGTSMTAAGMNWLAAQGLETAMLYVEAENAPALAVYRRLGFATNRTDRSWVGPWPSDS